MSFAVDVTSPYVLISGTLTGTIVVPEGGKASAAVLVGRKRFVVWEKGDAGLHQMRAAFDKELDYGYGYRVAVAVAGGAGGVEALKIETIVQLNPLTLPRLKPGANTVTVTCAHPEDLQRHALLVG